MPPYAPILKVMRIQSPSLANYYSTCTTYPTLIPNSIAGALLLPDSFGNIHVGETFQACLSVTNTLSSNTNESVSIYSHSNDTTPLSTSSNITNLTVNSYLQTPTQRHRLANPADSTNKPNGSTLPLGGHVDVFVSQLLEEVGQYVLRVEISYDGHDDTIMSSSTTAPTTIPSSPPITIRKFYRFQVTQPLQIRSFVNRHGDATCWISVEVENILPSSNSTDGNSTATKLSTITTTHPFVPCDSSPDLAFILSSATFKPSEGLTALSIVPNKFSSSSSEEGLGLSTFTDTTDSFSRLGSYQQNTRKSAVQLFDSIVRLRPHESHRYLFKVQAASERSSIRGIAAGDALGQVQITWRRSLGDTGCLTTPLIYTPTSMPSSILNHLGTLNSYIGDISKVNGVSAMDEMDVVFVVHASGLSVDAAAASSSNILLQSQSLHNSASPFRLEQILPVTVEPIDPPTKMILGCTYPVELLIVNHGNTGFHAHLQMRLSVMKGVAISGPSYINLGEIPPNGSTAAMIHLLALLPGLFQVRGCFIVDPTNGREIAQPSLFTVYVYDEDETKI